MGIINKRALGAPRESSVIQREGNSGIVDYKVPKGVPPVARVNPPEQPANHYLNPEESSRPIVPHVGGWMEKKLSADHMKFLWDMISKKKESCGYMLAGHVMDSFYLEDE